MSNMFSLAANFNVGSSPTGIAVGDFNNDGKLDIANTNYSSNTVSILLGVVPVCFSPLHFIMLAVASMT